MTENLKPSPVLTPAEAMAILRCGPKMLATLREQHPDLVAYSNGATGRGARYRYRRTAVLIQAGQKAGESQP